LDIGFKMKIIRSLLFILLVSCGAGVDEVGHNGVCEGYEAAEDSPYVLPYPPGTAVKISQGNCSATSHRGKDRYAYDFAMDIGNQIVAIRAGTVTELEESKSDGNGCADGANYIRVRHSDGSEALYVHLTKDGVIPALSDSVTQGQVIARSGNTGCSGGPHLHLQVESGDNSIPITFSNAGRNPRGLIDGQTYTAN
jgi:murein DD-endopeptidase MepM/ murein hydrolase activator NlpD